MPGFTRAALAVALLLPCPSCATRMELSRLDELARSTLARTVLLEEDLSLYSPHELVPTRQHLEQIRAQRDAVFGLFELERGAPLLVWLRPDEGMKGRFSVEGNAIQFQGVSWEPEGEVLGRASGNMVVLQVDPPQIMRLQDGREITHVWSASMYELTVRHELAHVASTRLGISGATWLSEGIAHAVEWIPIEEGRLRLEPAPEQLRRAALLPREKRSVARLLAWQHSYPPTDADRAGRLLSMSLVAFALERQAAPTFPERLKLLARENQAALRSLEPEWSAWLDRIAAEEQ